MAKELISVAREVNLEAKFCLLAKGLFSHFSLQTLPMLPVSLWGAARTFFAEYPNNWAGSIHITDTPNLVQIHDFLTTMASTGNYECIVDGSDQQTPVLKHANSDQQFASVVKSGCYLVTGGSGDIGQTVIDGLINKQVGHIVVVSRGTKETAKYSATQDVGCTHIEVVNADVANLAQLQLLKASLLEQGTPPINGVFHIAGIFPEIKAFEQQGLDELQRVWAPKVNGLLNLLSVFQHDDIDFVVNFSSWAGSFPDVGKLLGTYGAANCATDLILQGLNSMFNNKLLSVAWGDWAETAIRHETREKGLELLPDNWAFSNQEGISALFQSLNKFRGQVFYLPVDWREYAELMSSNASSSLLTHVLAEHQENVEATSDIKLNQHDFYQFSYQVISELVTGHKLSGDFLSKGLQELGLDSIMSFAVRDKINKHFEITLPIKLFISNQSVEQIFDSIVVHEQPNHDAQESELIEVEL
jgi:NAD(P)-dependent dehydrogenase (short-subunit alcohol dehydrogenase family)